MRPLLLSLDVCCLDHRRLEVRGQRHWPPPVGDLPDGDGRGRHGHLPPGPPHLLSGRPRRDHRKTDVFPELKFQLFVKLIWLFCRSFTYIEGHTHISRMHSVLLNVVYRLCTGILISSWFVCMCVMFCPFSAKLWEVFPAYKASVPDPTYICIFLIDFQKFQSVYLYCLLKSVFVVNRCRCFTEVLYLFLEHTSYINIFLLYS